MEKLYQQDPFLTRFTAQVVSCAADKGGWSVVLDRTAFYPEGGGQPWDTGTLNGIPVTQVQEQDGAVVHTCAARLEPGTQVEGAVDWARRFDLMQQHSGEHIVSGLIHSTYGYDNVGFHLGSDLVTIDFNGPLEEEDCGPTSTSGRTAPYRSPTPRRRSWLRWTIGAKRRSLGRSALSPSLGRTPAPAAGPMWHPPDRWGWSSFSPYRSSGRACGWSCSAAAGP